MDEEYNQLAREQAIYESTRSKCNINSEQVCRNPRNDSKDSLGRDHTMRRHEHYREWLGSQNIIDSIRNAEIAENSVMEILSCNTHPGYSGYPLTVESHDDNRNATPGPSRPRTTTMVRDLDLP